MLRISHLSNSLLGGRDPEEALRVQAHPPQVRQAGGDQRWDLGAAAPRLLQPRPAPVAGVAGLALKWKLNRLKLCKTCAPVSCHKKNLRRG